MSAETPMDESEIHDLVLMFANSRIPRGSDAFQTLVGDFMKGDTPEPVVPEDANNSDSSVASGKENLDDVDGMIPPSMTSALTNPAKKLKKSVRMMSPTKALSHVHWPDESNRNLASSPKTTQRHHARLFVKTTPKPILKHDDGVVVGSNIGSNT